MERSAAIIELRGWLGTPPGRYLLDWEQDCIDQAVSDIFGYHALQMGLPELDGLRANRMPHRWLAGGGVGPRPRRVAPLGGNGAFAAPPEVAAGLRCDAEALPFPSNSLDLIVMPHTLELAHDPHVALAEAARVLMPEGRLVIAGFNPASLWGLRRRFGRKGRDPKTADDRLFLPSSGEFIGYWRLRDWLRLLSFEIEVGRFGCYRPLWTSEKWLARAAWMDRIGDRWWPVLGAVYFLVAVRRVRGMRLIGKVRRERIKASGAPAVVANRKR
ncbi:MAG: methyltransferase domain-containing protein [Burkholderiaceae bacterium]